MFVTKKRGRDRGREQQRSSVDGANMVWSQSARGLRCGFCLRDRCAMHVPHVADAARRVPPSAASPLCVVAGGVGVLQQGRHEAGRRHVRRVDRGAGRDDPRVHDLFEVAQGRGDGRRDRPFRGTRRVRHRLSRLHFKVCGALQLPRKITFCASCRYHLPVDRVVRRSTCSLPRLVRG